MATNQEARHLSVRNQTGTSRTYNEDWIALFDLDGVIAGTFNERFIRWLQDKLTTTENNVNNLMQEYAESKGYANWVSMGAFTVLFSRLLESGQSQRLLESGDRRVLEG